MWIERWLVHSRGRSQSLELMLSVLGRGGWIACEAAHIRRDFLRVVRRNGFPTSGLISEQGLAIRVREGQMMVRRPRSRSSGDSDRQWLSALIDAMERVSRREVRVEPCDRHLLAAVKAQLARPVLPYRTWQNSTRRARRAPGLRLAIRS